MRGAAKYIDFLIDWLRKFEWINSLKSWVFLLFFGRIVGVAVHYFPLKMNYKWFNLPFKFSRYQFIFCTSEWKSLNFINFSSISAIFARSFSIFAVVSCFSRAIILSNVSLGKVIYSLPGVSKMTLSLLINYSKFSEVEFDFLSSVYLNFLNSSRTFWMFSGISIIFSSMVEMRLFSPSETISLRVFYFPGTWETISSTKMFSSWEHFWIFNHFFMFSSLKNIRNYFFSCDNSSIFNSCFSLSWASVEIRSLHSLTSSSSSSLYSKSWEKVLLYFSLSNSLSSISFNDCRSW